MITAGWILFIVGLILGLGNGISVLLNMKAMATGKKDFNDGFTGHLNRMIFTAICAAITIMGAVFLFIGYFLPDVLG